MTQTDLQENLARIQERIAAAAHRAGRRSDEITLIAVSKTHPAEAIRAAHNAGLRHFGENRVQEWEGKRDNLQSLEICADTYVHLIGHLQSNKAAKAARLFHSVDSVDDFAVAQRLDRARAELAITTKLKILLEVRVESEETKNGVEIDDLPRLAEQVSALLQLEFAGLMCIPPFLQDAEKVRPYFRRLRELRDGLEARLSRKLPALSMGMSHDFEAAIEEGATEIRVGTALFGERAGTPAKRG